MLMKLSAIGRTAVMINKGVAAILWRTGLCPPGKGLSPSAVMASDPLESRTTPISEEEAAALRRTIRKRVLWAAKLAHGAKRFDCVVVDLSLGGARIYLAQPLEKGELVTLGLDRMGALRAEVVWQEGHSIGLRFVDEPERIAELIGARLPLTAPPSAASA